MSGSSAATIKQVSYVEVNFSPPPGFELVFDGMKGTEELGRPFVFYLQMTSGTLRADVSKLIGSSASVWFNQSRTADTGEADKYVHGIVTRVVSEGLSRGAYRYQVELRPFIWLLGHVTDCRIFQNESPFKIVSDIFNQAGFSDVEDKRQNSSGGTALDYCVQYCESTLDFVTRLMEEYGFYYYFKHEKTKHTLVFADDPNAHTELPDKIPFQFDQTEYRTVKDHIWEWIGEFGLYSSKYTVRDYNFTTPSADLTSKTIKAPNHDHHAAFEVYEYPGPFVVAAEGQKLADVRMQAIASERAIYHGASNCRRLHAGWKFKLDKFPDKPANRDYLITRAAFSVSIAEGLSTEQQSMDQKTGETVDTYRVTLDAIPGDVPFRLQRITPRPVIRGPQTARVVGAEGEEITTDKYGRVKVKFHWDRSSTKDEDRTCWIRVTQSSAGNQWGSMFIPRHNMEVVVEFLEGNPDRPLITGVVYNGNQQVPYALPAAKTKSTIKSNSSQGGDGYNELRFDDKKDSEEVYFHAQKDYIKTVLHDEKVTITNDTTTTVKDGNRSVTVNTGNDSHTVSKGNRSVTVSTGDDSHTVSKGNRSATVSMGNDSATVSLGNHSLTVSVGDHTVQVSVGKSSITALTSITLTSGPSSIKLSPSGVEITGPTVSVKGMASMDLNGGASMSLTAAMISIN